VPNIAGNRGLYLAGVFADLINYVCDLLIAWSLYVLLAPVNRSVSLLAAWFRLIYTAVAVFRLLKRVTVFRLLNTPDALTAFGSQQLIAFGQCSREFDSMDSPIVRRAASVTDTIEDVERLSHDRC
jgi:hypothetical protein